MLIEDNKRYILRNGYICRPTAAYKSTFHSGGVYGMYSPALIFNPTGECLNAFNDDTNEFDIVAEAIEHIHWRFDPNDKFNFDIEYLYDIQAQLVAESFKNQFHVVTHEIINEDPDGERPTYNELQASNLKLHQRVAELEEFVKAAIYLSRKFKDLTEKHFHKLPKELQKELS